MSLLRHGNAKVGADVWTWSIPAIDTCPGASEVCTTVCYADAGNYRFEGVRRALQERLDLSLDRAEFLEMLSGELTALKPGAVVRIHAAGDFYSAPYIRIWIRLVRLAPHIRFYAYTRSWTVPRLRGALEELRAEPNVVLWASWDKSMAATPRRWHRASLDLEFRSGEIACPEQAGVRETCSDCGLCWRPTSRRPVRLSFRQH